MIYKDVFIFIKYKDLKEFPKLYTNLQEHGLPYQDDKDIILARSALPIDNINNTTPTGFIVVNGDSINQYPTITTIEGRHTKALVETLINHLKKSIKLIIPASQHLDTKFQVALEVGFAFPELIHQDTHFVLPYRQSLFTTKLAVTKIYESLTSGQTSFSFIITPHLAKKLYDLLSRDTEVGGKIELESYTLNGEAILAFDIKTLVGGKTGSVQIPTGAICFHTHPNICYEKTGCFIGWASGQDMMSVVEQYMSNKDVLIHLIPSKEGIWIISLTLEFQRVLKTLKDSGEVKCGKAILHTIKNVFEEAEKGRLIRKVKEEDQEKMYRKYIYLVNTYKIRDLLNNSPGATEQCSDLGGRDSLLYNVSLVSWATLQNPYYHKVVFIPDETGGLPPFLPAKYYIKKFSRWAC